MNQAKLDRAKAEELIASLSDQDQDEITYVSFADESDLRPGDFAAADPYVNTSESAAYNKTVKPIETKNLAITETKEATASGQASTQKPPQSGLDSIGDQSSSSEGVTQKARTIDEILATIPGYVPEPEPTPESEPTATSEPEKSSQAKDTASESPESHGQAVPTKNVAPFKLSNAPVVDSKKDSPQDAQIKEEQRPLSDPSLAAGLLKGTQVESEEAEVPVSWFAQEAQEKQEEIAPNQAPAESSAAVSALVDPVSGEAEFDVRDFSEMAEEKIQPIPNAFKNEGVTDEVSEVDESMLSASSEPANGKVDETSTVSSRETPPESDEKIHSPLSADVLQQLAAAKPDMRLGSAQSTAASEAASASSSAVTASSILASSAILGGAAVGAASLSQAVGERERVLAPQSEVDQVAPSQTAEVANSLSSQPASSQPADTESGPTRQPVSDSSGPAKTKPAKQISITPTPEGSKPLSSVVTATGSSDFVTSNSIVSNSSEPVTVGSVVDESTVSPELHSLPVNSAEATAAPGVAPEPTASDVPNMRSDQVALEEALASVAAEASTQTDVQEPEQSEPIKDAMPTVPEFDADAEIAAALAKCSDIPDPVPDFGVPAFSDETFDEPEIFNSGVEEVEPERKSDDTFLVDEGDVIRIDGNDGYEFIDLACFQQSAATVEPGRIVIEDDNSTFEVHYKNIQYVLFAEGARVDLTSVN